MNPRWLGLSSVIAIALCGCTRDNPSFGVDEGGDATAATDDGASSSFTGSMSASSTSGTSAGTSTGGGSDETGTTAECGNDIVEPPEECDKGPNNSNVGHCKVDCTYNVCGDGFVGPEEACDQPKDVNHEFCNPDCTLVTCNNGQMDRGEYCDPSAEQVPVDCTPICTQNVCGDGFMLGNEQCDDANDDVTDACPRDCIGAVCGDNHIWAGNEECDDGNQVDTDECVSCVPATCGDGHVWEGGEDCEGNTAGNTTCADKGFFAGVLSCIPKTCTFNTEGCHNCGNGVVDEGEQCDIADPVGPDANGMSCGSLGWNGDAEVSCTASCMLDEAALGECCVPGDQDCVPEDDGVWCCSQQCDGVTGTCAG
jgi:hypothetical protein